MCVIPPFATLIQLMYATHSSPKKVYVWRPCVALKGESCSGNTMIVLRVWERERERSQYVVKYDVVDCHISEGTEDVYKIFGRDLVSVIKHGSCNCDSVLNSSGNGISGWGLPGCWASSIVSFWKRIQYSGFDLSTEDGNSSTSRNFVFFFEYKVKIKLSLFTPWRSMEEWTYGSIYSWSQY